MNSSRKEITADTSIEDEAREEYGLWHAAKAEARTFAEFIGLPGFIMKSAVNALYPDQNKGKDVYLQGSRQMDSLSRQYIRAQPRRRHVRLPRRQRTA